MCSTYILDTSLGAYYVGRYIGIGRYIYKVLTPSSKLKGRLSRLCCPMHTFIKLRKYSTQKFCCMRFKIRLLSISTPII